MFMCNIIRDVYGNEIDRTYTGIKFTYLPVIKYEYGGVTKDVEFRDFATWSDTIGILSPSGSEFPELNVSTNKDTGEYCLRWIMMVKKSETYKITGEAGNPKVKDAEYYLRRVKQRKPDGKDDDHVKVQGNLYSDVTISIAIKAERKLAILDTKSISVEWKTVNTDVEAETEWFSDIYDANHNKINKVSGYYDLKPRDSDASLQNGGKSVKVCLDQYDRVGFYGRPIYFYRFEYYTRKWIFDWFNSHYEYYGPNVVETGTNSGKKAQADRAACYVNINFENLVDVIGEEEANGCILFDARVDMDISADITTAQLAANEGILKRKCWSTTKPSKLKPMASGNKDT